MTDNIREYHKAVCEAYRLGNVETAYNTPIITLLSHFGCTARDLSGARSGNVGENIDIKLWRDGEDTTETEPFAGVEVKKVDGIDVRARKQIKTEANRYGHMILTDNLEWQFWRAGEDKMCSGVRLLDKIDGKLVLREDNVELFISLVKDFLLRNPQNIRSSNKLAEYMAIHARTIRSVILGILKDDGTGHPLVDERQKTLPMFPELYGLYRKIKDELRPLLDTRSFADMYAQTIVYGLFIARYNDTESENFDKYKAIGRLQEESALLNRFFTHIASTGKTHPTLEAVIDKLCTLYQMCDISALLDCDKSKDTIVHFYEDFLTYYDPVLKKEFGVFYTPNQVVCYLVSMVDKILAEDFGIEGGLSNNDKMQITVPAERHQVPGKGKKWSGTKEITVPKVAVLDPACGTGTFHAEIIKYIKDRYFSGAREAFYADYIRDESGLLSRLIGFEIMMTSYVVAHLSVRRAIEETLGHIPDTQLPVKIYMTNTLAPPNSDIERPDQMSLFDFSAAITEEAYKADTWKTRRPVKVIIGNPPYLATSTNPFDISAYKFETDGNTKLQEKNSKLLNDDYVKFFRFAEQIIDNSGEGIIAFVSNNGYLNNPTFRGMRASLLRTFDRIFIVDLHGSTSKKEVAPDGGKDENIFDIMQGVALFIGIKTTESTEWAKVYKTDMWGSRKSKFQSLQTGALEFNKVFPDEKKAYFISVDNDVNDLYANGVSVTTLLPTYVSGLESGNDAVAIAPTEDELSRRIEIVKNAFDNNEILKLFGKFTSSQTVDKIQSDVLSSHGVLTPVSFRPFDERWTYYTGKSGGWLERPREKNTMGHLLEASVCPYGGKNIGLVFTRGDTTQNEFSMIFVCNTVIDNRITAAQTAGKASVAPLYIYSEIDNSWSPNLDTEQLRKLTQHLTTPPTPIEVFDYCYGVLYDPAYREKYNEFLKRDFPRVPIAENDEKFRAYVSAGEKLRKLHLLMEKAPVSLQLEPNSAEDLEIGSIKYKDGILHINANKRIVGISEDVWSYRIGGYQVLDKWFKSHKGRTMTIEDFTHIENVVGALAETIKVQNGLRELHTLESGNAIFPRGEN